tara:strand:+ start:17525 stop:17926 length:402 start_codon:yes stop_codon:yes gene_type:complete
MDKTFQEFLNGEPVEQLEEATSRGNGWMEIDSNSNEIKSLEFTLVMKSDADMPNIELDFNYDSSKPSLTKPSLKFSSGRFKDERHYKKFTKTVNDLLEKIGELELEIGMASGSSGYSKVQKELKKMGIKVKID